MPVRNSIKIILLNEKDELLLMCADDPKITDAKGKYHGRFWFLVGGKIEEGESPKEAALREIYEETGIEKVELGPVVWFGEFDLVLDGILTHLRQQFMVARTVQKTLSSSNYTEWEKKAVKNIAWFSLEKIKQSREIIYPVVLLQYLPGIILGKYPASAIKIDLARQP